MSIFRINTNVQAIFAHRNLEQTNRAMEKNTEKLSSGLRINWAADDAAGLAISERFKAQTNGLEQAKRNTQDGISLIQTAEGGTVQLGNMLQRMRTLAVQAANDTNTTSDRRLIQLEVNQLIDEIDRFVSTTVFNTRQLLTGEWTAADKGSLVLHVGANQSQIIGLTIQTVNAAALGLRGGSAMSSPSELGLSAASRNLYVNGVESTVTANLTATQLGTGLLTQAGAESAIAILDASIDRVNSLRANFGATQNRLEHTFDWIGVAMENQAAAESRIRDLDVASEIVDYTSNQILAQAGTAALAQANIAPQTVLQLLQ